MLGILKEKYYETSTELAGFSINNSENAITFLQQFKWFLISRSKVYELWLSLINIASAAIIFLG